MVRAVIQYERDWSRSVTRGTWSSFTRPVQCDAFRHGRVFGSPSR